MRSITTSLLRVWLLVVLSLAAGVASAAEPARPAAASTPQSRQAVGDLAYVLGEAHALHRACAGPEDNTWRGRMSRLLQVEAPDAAFRAHLMERFNSGFVARNAQFPTCTDKASATERTVAARGRDLARQLAADVSP